MGQFDKLSSLLERTIEKGPAGCACSVIKSGKVLYEGYFGYSDLDRKESINEDTIYRIFSMSKVITCTAALILYERGLYLLNDPLGEYMPEFKNPQVCRYTPYGSLFTSAAASPIRIKDLFSMSSGFTYAGEGMETARQIRRVLSELNEKYDARTLCKALAKVPLAFDPGTHWQYGYSHDILGALIEVLSGKSLGEFLKEEIFDPLGMKDTFFRIPEEKKHRLCSIYDYSEEGILKKNPDRDSNYQPDAVLESGGAGLLSTLRDYARFAQMLAAGGELNGERILGRKTLQLMRSNHLNFQQLSDMDWPQLAGYGYGLGVRVMIDPAAGGSNGSLGEFGWSGLAGSYLMVDPAEELSVVYMQQMVPSLEPYFHPRIRGVVYSCI